MPIIEMKDVSIVKQQKNMNLCMHLRRQDVVFLLFLQSAEGPYVMYMDSSDQSTGVCSLAFTF